MNSVYKLQTRIFKIYFNIIIPFSLVFQVVYKHLLIDYVAMLSLP